ncbi:MAG: hypothetical protein LBF59_05610 [Prevotellaceae bacterium]|nr:hypothetical protein [Prevotellaceae bacterium]
MDRFLKVLKTGFDNVDGLQTTVGKISTLWKPKMNKKGGAFAAADRRSMLRRSEITPANVSPSRSKKR